LLTMVVPGFGFLKRRDDYTQAMLSACILFWVLTYSL
jgi:hypothetical protein